MMEEMRVVTMIGDRPYVPVPEAARRKRVTRQAVWEACHAGRLAARQIGRFWYVPLDALHEWRPLRARRDP